MRKWLTSFARQLNPDNVNFWSLLARLGVLGLCLLLAGSIGLIALMSLINLIAWPFFGRPVIH